MTDREILEEVKKYPGAQIVLTGGEPSLQIDENFIAFLKDETGLPIAIETNGTRLLPVNIDWVTVSPKNDVTEQGDTNILCRKANELKVVEVGQDLDQYFYYPCVGKDTVMLLQPCHVSDKMENEKNTRRTIERVLKDPRWRLSLQTHRFIGIP